MRALKRVWAWWRWLLRRVGNFQATVLLSLVYVAILPWIAIPFKVLADPLRIKKHGAAYVDSSQVERTSMEAALKQ